MRTPHRARPAAVALAAALVAACGTSDAGSEGDTAPIVEDAVSEDIEGVTEEPEPPVGGSSEA